MAIFGLLHIFYKNLPRYMTVYFIIYYMITARNYEHKLSRSIHFVQIFLFSGRSVFHYLVFIFKFK